MGELRYCPQCEENRYVKMKISIPIFIILLLLGIIFGLIYVLYCYMQKQECAVCGLAADMMQPPRLSKMDE